MTDAFVAALEALPTGTFHGTADGRRYVVSRTQAVQGRAEKLVAHALDGSDYVSLNLYRLERGPLLKPCEMPEDKVVAFVLALRPEAEPSLDTPELT